MMIESAARTPLADTWWCAMSLVPVFGPGLAEQADPGARHPLATVSAMRWSDELAAVQEAQVAYIREGTERTSDAMARLLAAHEPAQAMIAGVGFSLALATLTAAPLRAWLDALPKLQACCATQHESGTSAATPTVEAATAAAGKTPAAKPAAKEGQ